ncbi:MAG: hypothetical protein OXC13_09975 [Caldilineaceae bacterium]|nr:hypothetical protein [Caldilineaceae bacterium]
MTDMDLLSDTVFPGEARRAVETVVEACGDIPVDVTQIHGLRQIARQQPDNVFRFARHQRARAEKRRNPEETEFWSLVGYLCSGPTSNSGSSQGWSLHEEACKTLPEELRYLPNRQDMKTNEDRQRRNQMANEQTRLIKAWKKAGIPVFFERFCAQCLYQLASMNRQR